MAIFGVLEDLFFPAGIFGDNAIFVGVIILLILILLLALRIPIWFAFILILPVVLIGGGSIIAGLIPAWIVVLIVIAIFTFVGLAYMSMTSGNR